MGGHHDKVLNHSMEPPPPYIPFLSGGALSYGALPDHAEDNIRNHPELEDKGICVEFP